ncbi:MAG: TPR end-of-group domain-containing protein [Calditrichia bacterium]
MRTLVLFSLLLFSSSISFAQNPDSLYSLSMDAYDAGDYAASAKHFSKLVILKGFEMSNRRLYNGACALALNGDNGQALKILEYLAAEKFYSNLSHIQKDGDLKDLHNSPRWKALLGQVKANKDSAPERNRTNIIKALQAAKEILQNDGGALWGEPLWNENVLVIDYDFNVYSIKPFEGSVTEDSALFYKLVTDNSLSFTNTTQQFLGEEYATVVINAIDDSSSTIIHELFHLAHLRDMKLKADPITYLDNYDARIWLRLEYEALRNALGAIDLKADKQQVMQFVNDAFRFRRIRQEKYSDYLDLELQLETVEGLANYTGIILSSYKNKYEHAIKEIDFRESAETFTRPFPYATGPAYGLLFDYLNVAWRVGFADVYNFLDIYESQVLKKKLRYDGSGFQAARLRNNFATIEQEEIARKENQQQLTNFYIDLFYDKPTLKVAVPKGYSMSFNMNGTMVLNKEDIVYSWLKGEHMENTQFGSFATLSGKDQLGLGGILRIEDYNELVFPQPTSIVGDTIRGFNYEMTLNPGWKVAKVNEKGDMRIILEATDIQRLTTDINKDGLNDDVAGWHQDSLFVVTVKVASEMDDISEFRFSFPLGDSMSQNALCGKQITMESEVIGDGQKVVKLSDGLCDAIRLVWSSSSEMIDVRRN